MDALLGRLALGYRVVVVVVALLPSPRFRALAAAGVCLLGLAAAAAEVVASSASGDFATLNTLLAVAGVSLILAGTALGLRQREPERLPLPAAPRRLDPLLLIGLGLAGFAPELLLFGLGAVLSVAAAARAVVRAARPGWLLPLAVAAGLLGLGVALLLTILGPESARLHALSDGPFSPAAERLLVLVLGAGGWLLAGLPPLDRAPWGRTLAPLAAVILGRVIVPAFPLGLLTWQVPAMGLLALGVVLAALSGGRWTQTAVAGGLLAQWSGTRAGVQAGFVLVVWGWLVETATALLARRSMLLRARWAAVAGIPAALAALPALVASLQSQVLLPVTAVAGCVAGFLRAGRRDDHHARRGAPLY